MENVYVIRHKYYNEKQSVRRIARDMGINRVTVKKYLSVVEPARVERAARSQPVMELVAPKIDAIIEEWKGRLTDKHRLTSVRLHRELIERGVDVGERTVRRYLAEARRKTAEVYIPLVHRPGDEAQVDFFEVSVDVNKVRRKVWKFLLRLMYSKRDVIWLYERCNQISFLDGHVKAFALLGCVPRRIIYDNLTSAVKRRLGAGERELSDRFKALSSHYLFEPCFARPGEGHDKGGVEQRGKNIRLQHLTPVVAGKSLEEISQTLQTSVDKAWREKWAAEGKDYGLLYDEDQFTMKPQPKVPFDAREKRLVHISRSATVTVMGAVYSTPSSWAGLDATAYIGIDDLLIMCRGQERRHSLQPKGGKSIKYRDYISELERKPQALRQVAPELVEELGGTYKRLWPVLESTHGQAKAARIFAGILGAIKDHGEGVVDEALLDALSKSGEADGLNESAVLKSVAGKLPKKPVLTGSQVPEVLKFHEIQSGRAADYDRLMAGGDL